MIDVPTLVVRVTDSVEEREKGGEVLRNGRMTGFTGARIEHVDDIEGDKDSGLKKRAFDVSIHKDSGEMSDGVDATRDSNPELAKGK
jgi:hypothetical protein